MNEKGEEQVSIVSTKAQADYLIARDVEETPGELYTIRVPGYRGKSVRAFEVAGDEPVTDQHYHSMNQPKKRQQALNSRVY